MLSSTAQARRSSLPCSPASPSCSVSASRPAASTFSIGGLRVSSSSHSILPHSDTFILCCRLRSPPWLGSLASRRGRSCGERSVGREHVGCGQHDARCQRWTLPVGPCLGHLCQRAGS